MLSNVNLNLVFSRFQTVIIYTHNYEMRNSSSYVPIFLTLTYVAYCQNLKTLFLPKFSIANFHIGVRARGVANFTGAAAFGGGVHPCPKRIILKMVY